MPPYLISFFRTPWFKQLLKIGLSAGLLAYCLTLVDFSRIPEILAECNWNLLSVAFILTLIGTIISKAFILRILLPPTSDATTFNLVSINLALRFYTMILAEGSRGWYTMEQISKNQRCPCFARNRIV